MSGFIEGENRYQSTLFPERVDDYVDEDSVTRVVDVFIDRLDMREFQCLVRKLQIPDKTDTPAGSALIDILIKNSQYGSV